MSVTSGYQEAHDQNHDILKSKAVRGMNYPCPDMQCILTFDVEAKMKKHLLEESHVREECVETFSTNDRIKKYWVAGLSGNITNRKEGIKK